MLLGRGYWQLVMKRLRKDVWKHTKRRRERLKGVIQRKKKVNEQFGRKMNEDANGNRKLSWKEERWRVAAE